MRRFGYLARLVAPTLVLGMLTFYADVIDGRGQLPLYVSFGVALLMGFLLPKGSWRWVILIGAGVDLAHFAGNMIDSSAISDNYRITGRSLAIGLLPALIGTYSGIFIRKFFSVDEEQAAEDMEAGLEAMHLRIIEAEDAHKAEQDSEAPHTESEDKAETSTEIPARPITPKLETLPAAQEETVPNDDSSKRVDALKRLESKLGLK